ncbi:hypothetical protein SAMN04487829_1918 [Pseudobutyrivibrio sp. NOR37]|uniref:Uncharacterized protein n=1 Tax=Pseudobutyrivibrio xylanivorans TaxID=185007 RepID=A0A6M0LID5_PSEXY|nr:MULTISPECIES: hypothetical protein [Pseudobutyrivibrio]NEX02295.1 hypothetical protein [Pseudobutyrivibrio xylanivorans]SFR77847.1 hypothetical protein SAMN04487829_1918 [Pseudobutyrivibrio sp. NOR37]
MSRENEYPEILEEIKKEVKDVDLWVASFDVIPVRMVQVDETGAYNAFLTNKISSRLKGTLYCHVFMKMPKSMQNFFRRIVGKNPK